MQRPMDRWLGESRRRFCCGLLGAVAPNIAAPQPSRPGRRVPVLVYHRFAATALDSMTVSTGLFRAHLQTLRRLDCRVVPLAEAIAWRRDGGAALPPRAVVLTADDGHRSQFETMAPMLQEQGWPATLFIYPSAISNASYAMTWRQLQTLAAQGLFDIQSHTYWHPNLVRERQRMSPADFTRFAAIQLQRSKEVLQQRIGLPVSLLAWPFGLCDEALQKQAAACGYSAALSLGNRSMTRQDDLYALPRHLMVEGVGERQLATRLEAAFIGAAPP